MSKSNNSRGLWSVVGMFIAAIVVFPLLLNIVNYFKKKNNFEKYEVAYFQTIVKVPMHMPELIHRFVETSEWPFHTESFTPNLSVGAGGRDNSTSLSLDTKLYVNKLDGKYYRYVVIVKNVSSFRSFDSIDGKPVNAILTAEEHENPKNGTKDNPYLIFGFEGLAEPLTFEDRLGEVVNMDTKKERFMDVAKLYFTYILSKENFKKRFPN